MKGFVISMLVCTTLMACNSETKTEAPAATTREVPVAKLPEKPPQAPANSEVEPPADLPVPADFEQEAETSITKSNYDKELDMLEKEIAADAPK
jgi:hypothetical protein